MWTDSYEQPSVVQVVTSAYASCLVVRLSSVPHSGHRLWTPYSNVLGSPLYGSMVGLADPSTWIVRVNRWVEFRCPMVTVNGASSDQYAPTSTHCLPVCHRCHSGHARMMTSSTSCSRLACL